MLMLKQGKIYHSFYLKTNNVEGQVENAETETEVRKRKYGSEKKSRLSVHECAL